MPRSLLLAWALGAESLCDALKGASPPSCARVEMNTSAVGLHARPESRATHRPPGTRSRGDVHRDRHRAHHVQRGNQCSLEARGRPGTGSGRVDPLRGMGALAEVCAQYVGKGSRVYVAGRLHTLRWEDAQTGERHARAEIVLDDRILLDRRGGASGAATDDADGVAFQAQA